MGFASVAGGAIGNLALLKFTSVSFGKSIGLSHPVTTPFVIIMVFGVLTIALGVFFHFYFKETVLESEKKGIKFSFG